MRAAMAYYELDLVRAFTSASAEHRRRRGWLVRLEADGVAGFGDAAPLPGHGGGDLAVVPQAIRSMCRDVAVARGDGLSVGPLGAKLQAEYPAAPAARAAVVEALLDLTARLAGLPLVDLLRQGEAGIVGGHGSAAVTNKVGDAEDETDRAGAAKSTDLAVPVNAVVALSSADATAQAVAAKLAEGFWTVKLKLPVEPDEVLALVRAVGKRLTESKAAHPDGGRWRLRGDANGQWDERTARELLAELARPALSPVPFEYVEQPVDSLDVDALARLRRAHSTPVAADEALLAPDGVDRVLELEAADVLILKPTLLGGPLVAGDVARRGAAVGIGAVVTSALESAVGRVHAGHVALAAASDVASGLAIGDIFASDTAAVETAAGGWWRLPAGPGIGLVPEAAWESIT